MTTNDNYQEQLARFKSSFHAVTGQTLDPEWNVIMYELTKDKIAVSNVLNNIGENISGSLLSNNTKSENILEQIFLLQKGLEKLSQVTFEKKASFLSILLKIHRSTNKFLRYFLGICFLGIFSFCGYYLYRFFDSFSSQRNDYELIKNINTKRINNKRYMVINIKKNNKLVKVYESGFIEGNILYVPIE